MAYSLRYTIPFVGNDIGDPKSYIVELYMRNDSGETYTPIELDGSSSPFEMTLDHSDDPMVPVRKSTAKISFVDDIEVVDLLPSDGFEWRVLLKEENVIAWTGYLTGEVFTQPYIEGPNIVTVNAVSATVPALSTPMEQLPQGSISVGRVIANVANLADVSKVYIPAIYTMASGGSYTDILRARFSQWLYQRYVDNEELEGAQIESDAYSNVVTDICLLMGWSFVDVGDGAIYFVAPGYTGAYMELSLSQLTSSSAFTPTLSTINIAGANIEPVDAADTMEVRQGYRAAKITAKVTEAETQFIAASKQVREWRFSRYTSRLFLLHGSTQEAEVGEKISRLAPGQIELPRWRASGVFDENGDLTISGNQYVVAWDRIPVDWSDTETDAYARYIEQDSVGSQALADGTAKRGWSFTPFIRLKDQAIVRNGDKSWTVNLPYTYRLVEVRSAAQSLHDGAIVIDFEVRASVTDGFYMPEDDYIGGGDLGSSVDDQDSFFYNRFWGSNKRIIASLSVGDKYWNGEEWTSVASRFDIPISSESGEWHAVASNKTIDMPYSGDKGLYIPIVEAMEGDVRFAIHAHSSEALDAYGEPYPRTMQAARADIKGLSLTFVPTLDFADVPNVSSQYYQDFERAFPEQKDTTLPLHSRTNKVSAQLSLLYYDAIPIDKLWRGVEEQKPEQFLLADQQRIFGAKLRRWRRGMALTQLRPIDAWRADDGYILMSTGATINYAEGVGEVNLTEIKTL